EDYLKGRYFLGKDTQAEWQEGVDYLTSAVQKDPTYAPAYSGLADFYPWYGGEPPLFDQTSHSQTGSSKGLNPSHGRRLPWMRVLQTGTFSLANIYLHQYWDWPAAEREIKRGLELNSNSPDAHAAYATYLAVMGRLNEAVTEQEQALRL